MSASSEGEWISDSQSLEKALGDKCIKDTQNVLRKVWRLDELWLCFLIYSLVF